MLEKTKLRLRALQDKVKLDLYTLAFYVGIIKETRIFTHDMSKPMLDVNSMKVVKSLREVVEYGRDIAQPNRYINGNRVEYHRTISVFNHIGDFFFVVLYKQAQSTKPR